MEQRLLAVFNKLSLVVPISKPSQPNGITTQQHIPGPIVRSLRSFKKKHGTLQNVSNVLHG